MAVATIIFALTSLSVSMYSFTDGSFLFYLEQGGFQFYISLTEELPDEVKTGVAQFEQVASVMVYKLNPFTLTGTVPCKYMCTKRIARRLCQSDKFVIFVEFEFVCLSVFWVYK